MSMMIQRFKTKLRLKDKRNTYGMENHTRRRKSTLTTGTDFLLGRPVIRLPGKALKSYVNSRKMGVKLMILDDKVCC